MPVKNRWGAIFTKGARVLWTAGSYKGEGRYLRLMPPSDYSRNYGRQVYVWSSPGTLPRGSVRADHPDVIAVGLDDLRLVEGRRGAKQGGAGQRGCPCRGKG